MTYEVNMNFCVCGCGMSLPQSFVDAYVTSRNRSLVLHKNSPYAPTPAYWDAYPHAMWWRSLEMGQVDRDTLEQSVLRGWARHAERLWMKETFNV